MGLTASRVLVQSSPFNLLICMHLLYLEHLAEGHSADWVNLIVPAALCDPRVSRVTLALPERLKGKLDPSWTASIAQMRCLSEAELGPVFTGGRVRRGLAFWRFANLLLRETGADVCFVPFMDQALIGACVDRRPAAGPVCGIYFTPDNLHGARRGTRLLLRSLKKTAIGVLSRRRDIPCLFTLDEQAAAPRGGGAMRDLVYVPDPAPPPGLFDGLERQRRQDGRDTYLLFGHLTGRKGVLQLLNSLDHVPAARQHQIAIRIAGQAGADMDARIRAAIEALEARENRVLVEYRNAYLDAAELAREVVNADAVLAPYQRHQGSSGVILWAASCGRPVITQSTGLVGHLVERHGLGLAIDTTDPVGLARSLDRIPAHRPDGLAEFARAHAPERFTAAILDGLFETLEPARFQTVHALSAHK